jgi:hypothetical protein
LEGSRTATSPLRLHSFSFDCGVVVAEGRAGNTFNSCE